MSEKTSTPVRVHTHTDLSIIHDARNTRHKSHFFTRKSRRRCERDTEKKNLLRTARNSGLCGREKSFQPPHSTLRKSPKSGFQQDFPSLIVHNVQQEVGLKSPFHYFSSARCFISSRRGIGRLGTWEGKEQFCPPPLHFSLKEGVEILLGQWVSPSL